MQMRYADGSNSMVREKRGLDAVSVEEGQQDRKRPAFSSVIVEALKVDSLQKLCSSLEPILRRVVSEEVERALAKLGPAKIIAGSSPKCIEALGGRNLQLHFQSRLALPLFTGGKIEGEQGAAIHVVLIDANTGHIVTSGPESSLKLDVAVLEGDFNNEQDDNWTQEEFESHVVKEREGKRPLLTGDLQVMLEEGVGTLGDLAFTDNSSWIRSRKFRLGLKVSSGCCEGFRIREAKTEAFTVKDHRGELYKKHYPPALGDEVWRLEKIGKDGSFHKRLNKARIYTVEDFLRFMVRDTQGLRSILGSGMSNKMWDVLVEHVKTCVLSGKLYLYYSDETRNVAVVFNNIYELSGLIANGQYYTADSLSDDQKVFVDDLVKKAYEDWMHVVEYDDKTFVSFEKNQITGASQTGAPIDPLDFTNSFEHQGALPTFTVPVPPKGPCMDSGYNESVDAKLPIQTQNDNLNSAFQLDPTSFPLQKPLINAPHQTQLAPHQTQLTRSEHVMAVGLPESSTSGFPSVGTSEFTSYRGAETLLHEEDVHMRSNEMLTTEDMHHLLRMFHMGGRAHASFDDNENGFPYSSPYMCNTPLNYSFGDDQTHSSDKAVIGWLKLKAALRWGIFVRKKADERRAQLVELDD